MHGPRPVRSRNGKAMILALLVPLSIPTVIGGLHAARMFISSEELNPPVAPYHEAANALEQGMKTLDQTLLDESTILDWRAWDAVERQTRRAARDPETAQPKPAPAIRIEYRIEVQGIGRSLTGRPYAIVNGEVAGIDEIVDGCTVVSIDQDSVVLADPTGTHHQFKIDESLRAMYPGYDRL